MEAACRIHSLEVDPDQINSEVQSGNNGLRPIAPHWISLIEKSTSVRPTLFLTGTPPLRASGLTCSYWECTTFEETPIPCSQCPCRWRREWRWYGTWGPLDHVTLDFHVMYSRASMALFSRLANQYLSSGDGISPTICHPPRGTRRVYKRRATGTYSPGHSRSMSTG